jgi:hypothetical protein
VTHDPSLGLCADELVLAGIVIYSKLWMNAQHLYKTSGIDTVSLRQLNCTQQIEVHPQQTLSSQHLTGCRSQIMFIGSVHEPEPTCQLYQTNSFSLRHVRRLFAGLLLICSQGFGASDCTEATKRRSGSVRAKRRAAPSLVPQ